MQKATLIFLLRDGEVMLIKKLRGIGAGFYNGPGGRMEDGETLEECAAREMKEEVGLAVRNLEYSGLCHFNFGGKPFMDVYVYRASEYSGEMKNTDEAIPEWFPLDKIPYDRMWKDDRYWFPLMLAGKKFEGTFWFDDSGKKLLKHEISSG